MKKLISKLTAGAGIVLLMTEVCGCQVHISRTKAYGEPPSAATSAESVRADTETISFSLPVVRKGTVDPAHDFETCLMAEEQDNGSFTAVIGDREMNLDDITFAADEALSSGCAELRTEKDVSTLFLPADSYIVIPGYRYMAVQELSLYNEGRERFTPLPGAFVGIEEGLH